MSDVYDLERLRMALPELDIQFVPETGSTNDLARELVLAGTATDATLILTDLQTAGRGQGDRKWASAKGNLAASWIMPLDSGSNVPSSIPRSVAVAAGLRRAIAGFCPAESAKPVIKWPNDILMGNGKVAGVLIEILQKGNRKLTITGIGINVNAPVQASLASSSESFFLPTSLLQETGIEVDLTELLTRISGEMVGLNRIDAADEPGIVAEYNAHLWGLNQQIRLISGGGEYRGVFRGVTLQGAIELNTPDGPMTFHSARIFPELPREIPEP